MSQSARVIGIPGAGKTTHAIEMVQKVRERGFSLREVGFCTFTRSARREAAQRAAEAFGVPLETLEKEGWFRTIHSACARLLRLPRGCIVNFDTAWLRDVLHDPDLSMADDEEEDDCWVSQWKGKGLSHFSLALWDVARNRLCSLHAVFDEAYYEMQMSRLGIDWFDVKETIETYEAAKERDGRLDFCDIILRYAGIRMTIQGPEEICPCGEVPPVPVWIFDEAQDTSPLLDRAARRLSHGALWTYLYGDPEQGIYSWAGANPNAFMSWPVNQEKYLFKTWRCARRIIDLGLELILRSDDLSKELRKLAVEARCDGGTIEDDHESSLLDYLKEPKRQTLIMARTNFQLADIHRQLTAERIPWRAVKSGARWPLLTNTRLCDALGDLQDGKTIDGHAFRRIVEAVPTRWLERGTKAFYKPAASVDEVKDCSIARAAAHGCKPELVALIKEGRFAEIVSAEVLEAYRAKKKWGAAVIDNPPIQVSTIHGSKGMQADKVILLTRITETIRRSLLNNEGLNEERRVWYVGATRARDELVLLRGRRPNYEEIYDCL